MNSFAPIDPALIDYFPTQHDGYPADLAADDTPDNLLAAAGSTSRSFPRALWIEPREWAERARLNDELRLWPMNRIDRFTNQTPTHECTAHSWTRAAEGCWNLQRGIIYPDGPKRGFRYPESAKFGSVWFSALSLYARANPGQWGGASIRHVLELSVREGILPDKIQPRDYGFEHVLHGTSGRGNNNQSSGPWVTERGFPSGWRETAKKFRPLEIIFPASWEEAVCLVLNGYFVCVGRKGHAIPWAQWFPERQVMAYPDSYDVIRYDSLATVKGAWRGSHAIVSMTTPDDWEAIAA